MSALITRPEPRTTVDDGSSDQPADRTRDVHRLLSAVAAAAMLPLIESGWESLATRAPKAGVAFCVLFLVPLVVLAVAASNASTTMLCWADRALLAVAVAATTVLSANAVLGRARYGFDAPILLDRATNAIAHGRNPYSGSWPALVAHAPTAMMDGRIATRYAYPPLPAELGALISRILPGVSATAFTCLLALLIAGVVMFATLPEHLRPLAVLVVFAVSSMRGTAATSLPLVVAMPFLFVAASRWTSIGRGGRLGRAGVTRAVCLGLAAACQQLVWFVLPFVLIALWRIRRGELDRRPAALVTARWAGCVAAAFALVNAPFVLATPGTWLTALVSPLTQHAFPSGPGIASLSYRVLGGSGNLQFFNWASMTAFVALLAATTFFPRQLGPGAFVIPYAVFWLAARTQIAYYEALVPVVIIAVVTVRASDFDNARPVRILASTVRDRGLRIGLVAALGLASVGCVGVAAASPAPLTGKVTAQRSGSQVIELDVALSNRSAHEVVAHFLTSRGNKISLFWRVRGGAGATGDGTGVRLPAGRSVRLTLVPSTLQPAPSAVTRTLIVVSDAPQTLSIIAIRGAIGGRV